jgi:cobalt ECF transporter T component CbiQ
MRRLTTRVWLGVLFFTGAIALPAIFVTPGEVLMRLPLVHWPITLQGVKSACYLLTRVETATTFSVLLVLTTPWMQVLKALRVLRVPVVFVVILGMTYRYIFVLLQTAADMFESRRSRLVGQLDSSEQRRLAAASVGVLLGKSLQLSSEVYMAMLSRGYRGEVYLLDEFKAQPRDWLALVGFVVIAGLAFWFGR